MAWLTELDKLLWISGLKTIFLNSNEIGLTYSVALISGVKKWFDIYIHSDMITMLSLVTICYHLKLLYNWLYSLSCILLSHELFVSWLELCAFYSPSLISLIPQPLSGNHQFSVSMSLFLIVHLFFGFLDYSYKWNHLVFTLTYFT